VNPLARVIVRQCAATGPMTVADYMALALGHPEHGYYMTKDPFGRDGDFITAPEISQIFGELIGLWCVVVWRSMGAPAKFILCELGPGRGTLMADALRAAGQDPDFVRAARIHLVETSPSLRERQRAALAGHAVTWHDRLEAVPDGPVLLIANEFFDALPAHQLVRTQAGWRERLVAGNEAGLHFILSEAPPPAAALLSPGVLRTAPLGTVAETQPALLTTAATIAARIAEFGGAALIVDYGHAASAPGNTLQAVRRHRPHDVLAEPGTADLTVHVDFEALARAAGAGVQCLGPVDQGEFLHALGIKARAGQLTATATPDQARDIASGVARLIEPDQMGTLFKALVLTRHDMEPPPGFEGRP